MSALHESDPLNRFTGLAGVYARCRPSYPSAAIDYIVERSGLGAKSLLVDVGSGTGISARLFAARGIPVLGIEPNDEMRAQAEKEDLPPGTVPPRYQTGQAETTGLANSCADVVLAAQAFHWFEPDDALKEFHRILKPVGWVVLMWNERDDRDAFTAAYSKVIQSCDKARALERGRAQAGEALLPCPLFEETHRVAFANEQRLDEDGMIGRALSASYAPSEPDDQRRFIEELRGVFARHQRDGYVELQYETSLYCGRKPSQ